MTDNEIIKALECCIDGDCDNCPWHEQTACNEYMKQDALDLINRQKAENSNLTSHLTSLQNDLTSAKAEIERYKAICSRVANIRSKAIKEFAERLKDAICENTYPSFDKDGKPVNVWKAKSGYDVIDNLVKEMVGEDG